MSARTDLVDAYFDGFRTTDHEKILGCLTDDVVWDLPGHRHLEGKEAFDGEIENEGFEGRPTLAIDRMIEGDDAVVVIGDGSAATVGGERFHFADRDVFTFRGDLVCRVESYLVPLT